jgi:hypothetical protein
VILEAEAAQEAIGRLGHAWTPTTERADFAGDGAVVALPDDDTAVSATDVAESAELRFDVTFDQPGVYQIWIRGWAPDGDGDSVFVGLDEQTASPVEVANFARGSWGWSNRHADGTVATIEITTAGIHTIHLWMREDGLTIDRLILSRSETYQPEGKGPRQSSRVSDDTDSATPTSTPTVEPQSSGDGTDQARPVGPVDSDDRDDG